MSAVTSNGPLVVVSAIRTMEKLEEEEEEASSTEEDIFI
jgi:hypothetical protein